MFSLGRFFGACLHFWKSAVSKSLSSIQSVARLQSEQEAPSVANMICQQISVQKHILYWRVYAHVEFICSRNNIGAFRHSW